MLCKLWRCGKILSAVLINVNEELGQAFLDDDDSAFADGLVYDRFQSSDKNNPCVNTHSLLDE